MELDPLRAYTDEELLALLGGMSRTTLWHIRDNPRGPHLLESGYLYPGSRSRRTTRAQILAYYARIEAHAAQLTRERKAFESDVDSQLERQGGVRSAALKIVRAGE